MYAWKNKRLLFIKHYITLLIVANIISFVFCFSTRSGSSDAKKVKAEPVKEESSSSESSDSDSDSDSDKKAPVKAAAAPVAVVKAAAKKDDSSSDSSSDSDSDEEKPAKKSEPVPVVAKKVVAKKVVAKKEESSSDSSDSDSDEEEEKPRSKAAAPVAAAKKEESSSSDSSSSDDDSEDEKPAAKKVATTPAKAATPAKKAESSDDSSSSSDSDSDEEEKMEEVKPKAVEKTPKKDKAVEEAAEVSTPGKEHKIYVKGLPWLATEQEVSDFFKDCGKITSCECPMGEDGRSSGTAFVVFSKRSELDASIALDGQMWPGTERWLKIQEAADKPSRQSFGAPGVKPEGCDTVFVGNLPWDVEEEQMRELFSAAGDVSSVRFAINQEDQSFRGFGHVSFYNGDDVVKAIELAGTELNGRAIRVDYAPPRNRPSFGGGEGGRGGGRGDGGRGGGRGRGDGGRGGRGGRGAPPSATVSKSKGSIVAAAGKKMTFDD